MSRWNEFVASLAAKSPEPFRSMGVGVFKAAKPKPLTKREREALSFYMMQPKPCPHGVMRGNIHTCYPCNIAESDAR